MFGYRVDAKVVNKFIYVAVLCDIFLVLSGLAFVKGYRKVASCYLGSLIWKAEAIPVGLAHRDYTLSGVSQTKT